MKKINLLFLFVFTLHTWAQDENYIIENSSVNRKFQDFGVSFINETTVVFSSARYEVFMKRVWLGNHEPFLSLYMGNISENGDIKNVKPYKKELESKFHDSNLVFTKDGKTVYFTRNNYVKSKGKKSNKNPDKVQIFKASINEKGHWINIQKLPFVRGDYDFGHPALNHDESKLYFVSNKPGGFGKTDIYVTEILNDSTYSTPKNLGPKVNTSKREFTPFIDANSILYYSSDGITDNHGGLDIYATKEKSDKSYYDPINLGYSINSVADDFGFVKGPKNDIGFFASNRELGKGSDDIYFFKENKPLQFECKTVIKGIVLDSVSNIPLNGIAVSLYKNKNEIVSSLTNEKGEFEMSADCSESYLAVAYNEKYQKFTKTIDSFENTNMTIKLSAIQQKNDHFKEERGSVMLNIEPIFYDLGKSTVHKESMPEIKQIAYFMKLYPEIIIQIRSHTDSRGSEKFNMNLSKRRAQTVKDLLIEQGVFSNRIFATGFGEMDPINNCKDGVECTEEEHLKNRRTDFIVLNPTLLKK